MRSVCPLSFSMKFKTVDHEDGVYDDSRRDVVSTQPPRSQISHLTSRDLGTPTGCTLPLPGKKVVENTAARLMSSPAVTLWVLPNPPPVADLLQPATFSLPPRPKPVIPSHPVPVSRNSTHMPRLPPRRGNAVSTLMGVHDGHAALTDLSTSLREGRRGIQGS